MYHIIYNPNSGLRKTQKAARYLQSELQKKGIEVTLHPTEGKGHATDIVRDLTAADDVQNIIVIGGDGTFSEAINGVRDFDTVNFGLIPCGTGNDFAKKIGLPTKVSAAAKRILDGKVDTLDYLEMDGRRCLNVCGAGMDVDVLVRYSNMKHVKGKLKYYLSLFDTLIHFKGHRVKYTVDGKSTEQDVFMIAVANGTYIGGGMPISPESDVRDGLLDVVVIDKLKGKQIPGALIKFLKGKVHKQPYAHVFKTTEAQVEILDEAMVQIDGEVTASSRLNCKIVPGKLRLFI